MGAVYAVEDEVLDRRVAIKVLASHLAEDPDSRERFVREARAAARLSGHPNVIQVYDVGVHEGTPYMVMELLDGGALSQRLRDGRPSLEQAVGWLRETAAALDFGHDQGIVHRDVKPSNLLLDDEEVVHVADFGIARIATDETLTGSGQILGTAAYLSPEQVLGRSATAASDNYALAVVAFELLTGSRPFRGGALAAQARQHVETEPPAATSVRADLPKALDPVLLRGLAKDPGERWPTAGAFVGALADGLLEPTRPTTPLTARQPRRATPVPPPPPPPPTPAAAARDDDEPPARRRGLWAIAALAAILVALGAAIALSDNGGGDTSQAGAGSTPKTASTKKPTKKPATRSTPPATSTPAASTPTSTPTPSTPSTSGASATALESQGHAKLAAGRRGRRDPAAHRRREGHRPLHVRVHQSLRLVPDLRLRAVRSRPRATARAATRPRRSPTLRDRLRIDDQRGTVLQELALAETRRSTGAAAPSNGGGDSQGHGQEETAARHEEGLTDKQSIVIPVSYRLSPPAGTCVTQGSPAMAGTWSGGPRTSRRCDRRSLAGVRREPATRRSATGSCSRSRRWSSRSSSSAGAGPAPPLRDRRLPLGRPRGADPRASTATSRCTASRSSSSCGAGSTAPCSTRPAARTGRPRSLRAFQRDREKVIREHTAVARPPAEPRTTWPSRWPCRLARARRLGGPGSATPTSTR